MGVVGGEMLARRTGVRVGVRDGGQTDGRACGRVRWRPDGRACACAKGATR